MEMAGWCGAWVVAVVAHVELVSLWFLKRPDRLAAQLAAHGGGFILRSQGPSKNGATAISSTRSTKRACLQSKQLSVKAPRTSKNSLLGVG